MGQTHEPGRVIRALVIGCGNRGDVYSTYSLKHPDRLAIVGFADSRPHVRKLFYETYKHTIEKDKVFTDWTEIFKDEKHKRLADCAIITLPDKLHKDAAIAFLSNGYHILLEKPMATRLDDCKQIALKCDQHPDLINAVCHVLRYYNVCIKLKQVIDSGLIGDIVNINHTEPVSASLSTNTGYN
jgi:predicted dehydrogenase